MSARRPSDPMGSRLWELEEGYCGESEHVDDLITLAWNIYHARDEARRANERLAGERDRLRDWLNIAKQFVWDEEIVENIDAELAELAATGQRGRGRGGMMADYFDVEQRWQRMAEQVRTDATVTASEEFQAESMRLQDDIESLKGSDPAGYGAIMAAIIGDVHPPQPKARATDDTRPAYDDLAPVVRALATTKDIYKAVYPRGFVGGLPHYYCVICDAGIRGEHAPDCLVSRARALAARLPPA